MPTLHRVKLEGKESVGDRLHASATDLLPADMRKDERAAWVLKHGALSNAHRDDEYSEDSSRPLGQASRIAISALRSRLPSYYATLFHIARMRTVTSRAMKDLDALRSRDNLESSISNLLELSGVVNHVDSATLESELRTLCEAAEEQFSQANRRAVEWWGLWISEVSDLKESVEQFEKQWSSIDGHRVDKGFSLLASTARLVLRCYGPSRLVEQMTQEGVPIQPGSVLNVEGLWGLLGLAASVVASGGPPSSMHHAAYVAEEWIRNDRHRRMQPQIDIALDILKSRCGVTNPFLGFLPMAQPASPQLRNLLKEHTLPDNSQSPWRREWENRLDSPLRFGSWHPLALPSRLDSESLAWVVRAADSSIKRHLDEDIAGHTDWSGFLQKLYESHCIEALGSGAGSANQKERAPFTVWSTTFFVEYVQAITTELNLFGYVLQSPSSARLTLLLEKASRGESVYRAW
jgi:hypothetical protein